MLNRRGQNTAEYAILIALVIAAAVAMQTYVKRSVQGGVKYTVDKLKDKTGQYEPYYLQSEYDTTQKAFQDIEETKAGGQVERTFAGEEGKGEKVTTRAGYQKMKAYEEPKSE